MTVHVLFAGLRATTPAPTVASPPRVIAQPSVGAGIATGPQAQTFALVVTGDGAVSAQAQVVVSHDQVNWAAYGDPITATGTQAPLVNGIAIAGGGQDWPYFAAYLLAISGTNAAANLTMNA